MCMQLQRESGGIELQSAGLPLPETPLRWLAPLNRPLLYIPPTPDDHQSFASDTVMQDAAPCNESQGSQMAPAQIELNQQDVGQPQLAAGQQQHGTHHQTSLQPQAAGAIADAAAAPIQTDTAPQLQPAALHQDNRQSQLTGHQQSFATSQPQVILAPEGLQDAVSVIVAKCDQQLLSRQEEVLVSLVEQRVAEEVRQVQGAQDMDHPADELVQRVRVLLCMLFSLLVPKLG